MGPIHQYLSKVYTGRTSDKAVCLTVLLFYVLPIYANIMTDKGLNLFDECDARCLHLSLRKKSACLLPEVTVKLTHLAA